jgi:hypothetical protein
MSTEKQAGALGKGLDALINKKYVKKVDDDSTVILDQESGKDLAVEKTLNLNEDIVEGILVEIKKNPRISLWSAKSAAVLRYLRKTEPEFSISSEASLLIEKAVKEKYPEIWDLFEEHI